MKHAIVTGATGMIGVALVEECIKNNVLVTAVVRPNSTNLYRLPSSKLLKTVACDMDEYSKLPFILDINADIFYHFAWSVTDKRRNDDISGQYQNIQYTLEAIQTAKMLGCDTFIGAGSQAEYGVSKEGKIGPDTPTNPVTPYGISKYAAGKFSMILCERLGLKCIWTRIFSVYGKYDNPSSMISSTLEKFVNGEKAAFTPGIQLWDYLYSEDAGRAFYLLGEKGSAQRIYCIASGQARPLYEFIKMMRDAIDFELEIGIGEIPYSNDSVMNLCADISNLTADTGFIPTIGFNEGIHRLIKIKQALNSDC